MEHVLVVDDDNDFRYLLRMMLEEIGYSIEEAVNGQGGLACIRKQGLPCVVLLDRRMPLMNGIDMLAAVFKEPDLFHHHRFILMSTSRKTLSSEMMQGITAHEVHIVDKPFENPALERLIATLYKNIPPA